jgi:MFS family permease
MLVSLLGTAGIALPYPILSPFFLDPASGNALTRFMDLPPKILLGILLALYPLGMLVGSSFIGALSDVYGRKPVLAMSLLAASAGYGLTGYAVYLESYPLFALARLLTGICEGNIAISRAIALELHPVIDRTRAISLLYATNYAGWLVGPLAGGYLMYLGVDTVFYIAGVVTLVTILVVAVAVVRQAPAAKQHRHLWQAIAANNSLGLLREASMRPLIMYHLLFALGLNAFYEFYPLWLVEAFSFSSVEIGWSTVVITLAMIISSIYATGMAEKRFGHLGTVRRFSLVLGLLLVLLPATNLFLLFPGFVACGAAIAVANGVFPGYMANRFEQFGHGRVQGLLTTNFCAANVITSLAGSVIALLGAGWSIVAGGLLCCCASLWLGNRVIGTPSVARA